jgi:F0F1-type ATP synthase assembly protein I
MNLFELLFVALVCGLIGLLGRFLFGTHGWLVGAVPFGLIVGLVVTLPIFKTIRRSLTDLKEPVERNRQRQRNTSERPDDD